MVLRAEEELAKTLQRLQRRRLYFSSETDRLGKYFFMLEKSCSQNKNNISKVAESRKVNVTRVCDVW